jgi:hypothetical protein
MAIFSALAEVGETGPCKPCNVQNTNINSSIIFPGKKNTIM